MSGNLFNIKIMFKNNQQGAALLLLLLIIIVAGTTLVVTNFSVDRSRELQHSNTATALAKAKEALIAYAVTFHDTSVGTNRAGLMGFLPCPDDNTNNEGVNATAGCGNQYESYLGRLPWKTLGIDALKDSSGSCLWYVVSGEYKNIGQIDRGNLNAAAGLGRNEMLNEDSNGSFTLFDQNGNQLKGNAPDDRVVAVIIAPGRALAGQNRAIPVVNTQCGGDYTAANYLETFNGVDNRSITTGALHSIDDFITSDRVNNNALNDRMITITQREIFDEIKRRNNFDLMMQNTTEALAACIAEYGKNNPGTGCDLNICLDQCDDSRDACRDNCDAIRDACIAGGGSNGACNSARGQCYSGCNGSRNSCRTVCNTNCTLGGGGNIYRLPWPALMNFNGVDYRDSTAYAEDTAITVGRFPVDVTISNGRTGNAGMDSYLLEDGICNSVTAQNINLNTNPPNSIERRIWQNWKDHFFYVVAEDFASDAANSPTPTSCATATNCITVDTNNFAAAVFFSSARTGNQIRTVPPNDADTKRVLGNYLEGDNIDGDNVYETNITNPNVNDTAFCIDRNMVVSDCQ